MILFHVNLPGCKLPSCSFASSNGLLPTRWVKHSQLPSASRGRWSGSVGPNVTWGTTGQSFWFISPPSLGSLLDNHRLKSTPFLTECMLYSILVTFLLERICWKPPEDSWFVNDLRFLRVFFRFHVRCQGCILCSL